MPSSKFQDYYQTGLNYKRMVLEALYQGHKRGLVTDSFLLQTLYDVIADTKMGEITEPHLSGAAKGQINDPVQLAELKEADQEEMKALEDQQVFT